MSTEICVFCKIILGEIPTEFVHEDRDLVVFKDINPKAKVHFLVVPRVHIPTFLDLSDNQMSLLTKIIKVIQRLVEDKKLQAGYQILINGGRYQHINHLHVHLLGD